MYSVMNFRKVVLLLAIAQSAASALLSAQSISGDSSSQVEKKIPFTIEHADHFFQRKSKQDSELFILEGNVEISRGESHIACGSLTYFPAERYILCLDSVFLSDPERRVRSDTLFYYLDRAYYRALGSLEWATSGFRGTGLRGDYYRGEGRMVVEGEAAAEDSLREIKADKLEYDESSETLRATGNLRITDSESRSEAVASSGLYQRKADLVTLYGRPKVNYYDKADTLFLKPYHLISDLLHSYGRDSLCATGRVRLWDDSLTVTADSLFHNRIAGLSYFRGGGPQVEHQRYFLKGSLIDVATRDRKLERIRAVNDARGEFYLDNKNVSADSADRKPGESSWIEGDTLDLIFGPEGLDSIAAEGKARSYFRETSKSGVNYLQGARILLIWQAGDLARVEVERGGRGLFLMPDTTGAKSVTPDSAGLKPVRGSP
ncbi:MAG TPA: LptA/OstA family protein [archaeon]|nr:LptA/OstA family protein [archaeon]